MDAKAAIRAGFHLSQMTTDMLLADLSDADLMVRVAPGANHIAWQLGQVIETYNQFVGEVIRPGRLPPLPAGFGERYTKEGAASDNPADFLTKDEYLRLLNEQRAAVLQLMDEMDDSEFDKPTAENVQFLAKTLGELLVLASVHEMMHTAQITPVRRLLGKPHAF